MYYIALVIIALIFIWRIGAGFHKGMVREIGSLAALAAAGLCLVLILGAAGSYLEQEMGKLLQMIVVLLIVCVVYRLVHTLFVSLELISKLPLIKGLDKLLGAAVGFAEALLIVGISVHFLKNWGLSFFA